MRYCMRKLVINLRLGLQLRAVAILAAVVVLVTAVGGWSYYANARNSLRQSDNAHAANLAHALAVAAQYHLRDGQAGDLQRLASDFLAAGNVRFIAIVAPVGEVMASASRDEQQWPELMNLATFIHATDQPSPDVLTVARPVVIPRAGDSSDHMVGAIRVVFDTRTTTDNLLTVQRRMTHTAACIVLAVIPLGYLLLSRLLVQPLRRLVGLARRLGKGDFAARLSLRRNDEIGELATAFNTMAGELSHMRGDLIRANEDLEEKVAQRTEQIRHANVQLEESMAKLRTMAETDHLTGLANRRRFAQILEAGYDQAVRYGHDIACVMCDLDHYKQLNDALGHQKGDEVLALAADTIRAALRTSDVAARYGGDEFVILLPHTSVELAMAVGERIRHDLVLRMQALGSSNAKVTMSMGVASLVADRPPSGDGLVSMADRALYMAKDRGKNQIVALRHETTSPR